MQQFPTAFVMAIVGIVDSVVAARENGSKYGYAVSANRDLVALGGANVVASSLLSTGSLPVFGSISSEHVYFTRESPLTVEDPA